MKAKVLVTYRDRTRKTLHKAGSTVSLTAERLEELEAGGYVERVKEPRKKAKPGTDRQTKEEKTDLDTK